MKPGTRVRYVGKICPGLQGREGTFRRYDRKGWALVLFDCNPIEPVKCAQCNIEEVKPQ